MGLENYLEFGLTDLDIHKSGHMLFFFTEIVMWITLVSELRHHLRQSVEAIGLRREFEQLKINRCI